MRDAEAALWSALERWQVSGATREWQAVLDRAQQAAPARSSPRRVVVVAAAAAAALVVAPASALVAHLRGGADPPRAPGLSLTADFPRGGPVSGRLTIRTSRLFLVVRTRAGRTQPRV